MEKSKKKYYSEINIARGIAVICVLLGHAFPDADLGITEPAASWMHDFVYSFHMGCFFILSGFVSARKLCSGNLNLKDELIKKLKRLMVPYLFYSFITMGLKQIFSAFANHQFDITEFWSIFLGKNPNGGLWFLWNLFTISMIFAVISKINKNPYLFFIVGAALYIVSFVSPFAFGIRILKYAIFYSVGIILNKNYEKIKAIFDINIIIPISLCILIALVSIGSIDYFITCIIGSYIVVAISYKITIRYNNKVYRVLDDLGTYSFDIYLISYFVQVPIRVVFWRILNCPYYVVVLAMFILGTIIPWILSKKIIRKIPIANKVMLGNF